MMHRMDETRPSLAVWNLLPLSGVKAQCPEVLLQRMDWCIWCVASGVIAIIQMQKAGASFPF